MPCLQESPLGQALQVPGGRQEEAQLKLEKPITNSVRWAGAIKPRPFLAAIACFQVLRFSEGSFCLPCNRASSVL